MVCFYHTATLGRNTNVQGWQRNWGYRCFCGGIVDERPEPDGTRLRDTQCGLFATGKVLRRFGVPFTYMTNCRLEDPVFERGLRDFMAVCNVVKTSAISVSYRLRPDLLISGRPCVMKANFWKNSISNWHPFLWANWWTKSGKIWEMSPRHKKS